MSLPHIKRLCFLGLILLGAINAHYINYINVMNNIVHLRKGFQLPWRYMSILKSECWNHKLKVVSVCFRLGIHLHCHFLYYNLLLKVSVEPLL